MPAIADRRYRALEQRGRPDGNSGLPVEALTIDPEVECGVAHGLEEQVDRELVLRARSCSADAPDPIMGERRHQQLSLGPTEGAAERRAFEQHRKHPV